MKKIIAVVLALVMVLGMSAFVFADDAVSMKIAVWTSNESQLELLGSFVQEFAEKKGLTLTSLLSRSPMLNLPQSFFSNFRVLMLRMSIG